MNADAANSHALINVESLKNVLVLWSESHKADDINSTLIFFSYFDFLVSSVKLASTGITIFDVSTAFKTNPFLIPWTIKRCLCFYVPGCASSSGSLLCKWRSLNLAIFLKLNFVCDCNIGESILLFILCVLIIVVNRSNTFRRVLIMKSSS